MSVDQRYFVKTQRLTQSWRWNFEEWIRQSNSAVRAFKSVRVLKN